MRLRKLNINNELNLWNEIINNSPDFHTIAHNPSLIQFLSKTMGWDGDSFFILDKGNVIAIYQHSYVTNHKAVSLPHFSYGGIIRKNNSTTKKEIFDGIRNSLPRFFEIRDFEPYSDHYSDSKIATYLELKLTVDQQLAYFKANHRRKILKANNNNLEITISSNTESIELFYNVYSRNMLRLGSPPLSKDFFLGLLNEYKFGEIKIFIVKLDDQVVGGAIVVSYNNFMEDCWLSTLNKYNYLNVAIFLYWEMIKYAIITENKYFSFGRSTQNSSLFNFKKRWLPIQKKLYFSYSEQQKTGLRNMTFLPKIWRYLPLRVANFIGSRISEKLY